jgi:hypothetical protein
VENIEVTVDKSDFSFSGHCSDRVDMLLGLHGVAFR